MRKTIIIGITILIVAVGGYFVFTSQNESEPVSEPLIDDAYNSNIENISSEDNTIKLPENVITEEDCLEQGGEIFNTLGETSYSGKLIGKIEGMRCPCACMVAE